MVAPWGTKRATTIDPVRPSRPRRSLAFLSQGAPGGAARRGLFAIVWKISSLAYRQHRPGRLSQHLLRHRSVLDPAVIGLTLPEVFDNIETGPPSGSTMERSVASYAPSSFDERQPADEITHARPTGFVRADAELI